MYYVYKTTNMVNNKIYVGVHKSDNIQSDQYLGSGEILNKSIAKYGRDKFKRQILYQFQTKEEAYTMERLIVDKQFVKRKDTYNIKFGGQGGFGHMQGSVFVKDKQGNVFRVDKKDKRINTGQFTHITKGFFAGKDKEGNIKQTSVFDPRYITGEIVGVTKDRIVVKDSNNNTLSVNKNDPRYLQGELVGVAKGNKMPKNHQRGSKNSQYGTMWITNGIQNKKIKKEQNIPQGWKKGRFQY